MQVLMHQIDRRARRLLTALGACLYLGSGLAAAQIPVTAEQAAELVQAQTVAGSETRVAEAEAAATSVVEFDPLSPQVYGEGTITQIVVRGNERLSTNTILTLVPIQVGDDLQPLRLDAALKALYA